MADEPVGPAVDDAKIAGHYGANVPRFAQRGDYAQPERDGGDGGGPAQCRDRTWRRATAPRAFQGRQRKEAKIDGPNPYPDGSAGLRRLGLPFMDLPLVSFGVEQLNESLCREQQQNARVAARTHAVSRMSASSIESPGPRAIASTRPEILTRCISSSTKKMPALDALPLPANTERDVASASGRRSSARSMASTIRGPPGCAATASISVRPRPRSARNVSTAPRKCAATTSGSSRLSITRSPPSRSS